MRPHPDPTFDAAVEAGRRACAVARPVWSASDENATPGIRPERVVRCQALIADGLYETEDRLDAAIHRLTGALDESQPASTV